MSSRCGECGSRNHSRKSHKMMFLIVGAQGPGYPAPPKTQTIFGMYSDLEVLKRDAAALRRSNPPPKGWIVSFHAVPFGEVVWHDVIYGPT